MSQTAERQTGALHRMRARLVAVRSRARSTSAGRLAWRIGVTVLGVAVVVVGVLLLALPGPGWLIIFAGLGLLATEYPWAARLLSWLRAQVLRWTAWVGRQRRAVQILVGAASLIVLAAVAFGAWYLYRQM